ncbi:hypothetical protein LPTSP4_09030 [Leptospira ryugenii]|uniref:Uncharacterized protein n=1 Tax=Leptospira ryugenii TaxID=1917863 RepID=A0A2P2DXT8_9LEPT|nr:hypothetical protein [Leptospira ryugenii]GBF49390.1 hypothetical protein LPTSP4_09030 [Leptospira ryugenii]
MINSDEAFRSMKTAHGKRKSEYPESIYTFEFFTETGKTIVDGENIPTSFKVLNHLLKQPLFITYEIKKDGEVFTAGQLKVFEPEEKEIAPPPQVIETSPLDIMKATFEMNRLYSEDLERVTKKYSSKFAEYDQEVEQRINKQKEALNEKLDTIEYANKRKMEIQQEEFDLERKRWNLEKEQILARRKTREERFSFGSVFAKVTEGALEALSANPEQSINLAIHLAKIAGKAWRGEAIEIPVENS